MPSLVWKLAAGFDGLMIDSPAPGASSFRVDKNAIIGNPGNRNRADRVTNRSIERAEKSTRGYFKVPANIQGTGMGGLIDGMYVVNQVANKQAAETAETVAMKGLQPSIIALMPRTHGGVLVVSTFGKSGPAVNFRSCYAHGGYPTMAMGVSAYHSRGSITARDSVSRLWWVTADRPKLEHKGPPTMQSWP